jgi:hypothetical protein
MTTCSCDTCGESLCPGDVLCGSCGKECDPDKTRGFTTVREANRGDTLEIEYDIVDQNGARIDVTANGVLLWFTIKDYLTRADSQAAWQGTLGSGIEQLSVGTILVTVPPAATQNVSDGIVRLYYDLQIRDVLGRVATIEKGIIELSPDVTRSFA